MLAKQSTPQDTNNPRPKQPEAPMHLLLLIKQQGNRHEKSLGVLHAES